MIRVLAAAAMLTLLAPAAYAQPATGTAQVQDGRYLVFFPLDQATLDETARRTVAAAAEEYMRTGAARIGVTGYTDTSGSAAYNQELSERRAKAVADELVRLGVPSDEITTVGIGENDLLVPTADGVTEPRNRRVEIEMERPAPPPPVAAPAPAPAPEPAPVAEREPQQQPLRGIFSLGALYGLELADDGDEDKTSHLAGVNLSFDYGFTNFVALSLEQAGFYNFLSDDNGFGGRTAAGLTFFLGQEIVPFVGANIGYLYGPGIEDDFFAGPEVGLNFGLFNAKVAYDVPFDRGIDEGIVLATVGLGIQF